MIHRRTSVRSHDLRSFRGPRLAPALAWAAALLAVAPAQASRFATGVQIENWSDVDLDLSQNPKNNSADKIGFSGLEFDVGPMVNYYLEEPGFIFSLISGMANTEANEVSARNEAIRKGELSYTWEYAKPAPIPEGRWFRWGSRVPSPTGPRAPTRGGPWPTARTR